ncbi:MAG: response regulator transcription factor [Alphaproteobacteria bacterium]|nr:response regulator transcription factor [Alphaproteobacteria bacterium]
MNLLLVEDDPRLGPLLRQGLAEQAHTVQWAQARGVACDALRGARFDLVILDLGLPDGDGLEAVRDWRASGFKTPILIVSGRNRPEDRAKALELGADDYLPKPFGLAELLAKMRALTRRDAAEDAVLVHKGIRLDLVGRHVFANERPVELSDREYALLVHFMRNSGRVLTRTLLAEKVWSSHYDVDMNLLDVFMSRLRGKLETALGRPVFRTVRGIGYRLL